MSEGKWQRRDDISPAKVLEIIREYGAPTTSEIKWILRTDSQSIRKPLAILWGNNKIYPFPAFGGLVFIEVDGKRGRPNPTRLRKERGREVPRKEKTVAKIKKEMAVTTPAVTDLDTTNPITRKWSKLIAMSEMGEITERQYQAACRKLGIHPDTGEPVA